MVDGFDIDRSRMGWLLLGGVLAFALLLVVHSFVGTFVFGLFIYYSTRPIYDRLVGRFKRRGVAALVSLVTLALPMLLLFFYTLAVALQEFNRFSSNNDASQMNEYLGPYLNASAGVTNPRQIVEDPGTFFSQPGIRDSLGKLVDPLLSSVGFVGNALLHLFVMIVLAYYLLKDGRRLSRWFQHRFADDRGVLTEFFRVVDRDFQNIFFGNILNAFLTAIIGAFAYSVLDAVVAPGGVSIPYATLVGLLTGLGSLIPVIGMKIVYFPVAAYLTFDTYTKSPELLWFPLVFVVVSVVVVDVIPDLVLRPYVSGRSLHVGAVMLAYTLGPMLWGWYGIFLGPVVLVLVFHFARVVLPELVSKRSLAPYAIDPTYMDPPPDQSRPAATPVADGETVPDGEGPPSGDGADPSSNDETTGSQGDGTAESPGDGTATGEDSSTPDES